MTIRTKRVLVGLALLLVRTALNVMTYCCSGIRHFVLFHTAVGCHQKALVMGPVFLSTYP